MTNTALISRYALQAVIRDAVGLGTVCSHECERGSVECRINYKVRSLPAVGPLPTADAGNWLAAFWLSVICREPQRMTQLCEIPTERLRSPERQYDEYICYLANTLQTYWLRRPGLVEKLTATLQSLNRSVARIAPRDLLYPAINLFYHPVQNDREGFSPALIEALKLHQAHWPLSEERAANIDGSIARIPLTIACRAHDGEFPT